MSRSFFFWCENTINGNGKRKRNAYVVRCACVQMDIYLSSQSKLIYDYFDGGGGSEKNGVLLINLLYLFGPPVSTFLSLLLLTIIEQRGMISSEKRRLNCNFNQSVSLSDGFNVDVTGIKLLRIRLATCNISAGRTAEQTTSDTHRNE